MSICLKRKNDKNRCSFRYPENEPENDTENDPEIGTGTKNSISSVIIFKSTYNHSRTIYRVQRISKRIIGVFKAHLSLRELPPPRKKPSTLMYKNKKIHFWGLKNCKNQLNKFFAMKITVLRILKSS